MSMFGDCAVGQHKKCPGSFEQFYVEPKTNKPVYTGETIYCQCNKRGCACFVPAKDRAKKTTRKRKK